MKIYLEFEDGHEEELDGAAAFYPTSPDIPNSYMVVGVRGVSRFDNVASFHISN